MNSWNSNWILVQKTLFLAVESIICLMRDVELQEEAAEQAKLEAAKGGLDMLERVEDLKEMLQHAKEANDMVAFLFNCVFLFSTII